MNAVKKHRGWILSVSLFSAVVVLVLGVYIGYQLGLRAYDDILLDELLADIYYADDPVDCPPCDQGATYEWFYVEPPIDSNLWEEQHLSADQEETVCELRHEEVKPQKPVNDEND